MATETGRAPDESAAAPDPSSAAGHGSHLDARTEEREDDGSDLSLSATPEEIRLWQESRWAVGFTKPTWKDEPLCWKDSETDCCTPLGITACLCRCCAGRVGNMVVFTQTADKLVWMMGPYWMMLVFVTIPALGIFSFWVAYNKVTEQSLPVVITWSICTGCLFVSLLLTGCRDPGILRRTRQNENENWRWNDQALTYRPASAKYDPECAAVILEFDHTCPWTGTAIGKNNMATFKLFLTSLLVCLAYNVVLLVLL